jgi:hypothetical protein
MRLHWRDGSRTPPLGRLPTAQEDEMNETPDSPVTDLAILAGDGEWGDEYAEEYTLNDIGLALRLGPLSPVA